mmetsp:Transcript_44336/g.94371  ORF Transcript_44336/g.94371 Transcript_44336/m.94371 type:complete len:254 (-) Transcript_44336:686-1447(-)
MIPAKYLGKLASPFLLAHGTPADCRTWVPLFSVCYFHHENDGDEKRSKNQSNAMDGIVIGRSMTSNALKVYNPRNKKYYEPDNYRIDPHRLPCALYPDLKYDGGLFCTLYRDAVPRQDEPFPPGTRVDYFGESIKTLRCGTVVDIPMDPTVPESERAYLVQLDSGQSVSVPVGDMPKYLPRRPTKAAVNADAAADAQLPSFLQVNQKITYEKDGEYHKGYLKKNGGLYRFVYKRHPLSKNEEWGVDLPDLHAT